MRFADSETQKLLRDTARSYLAEHFSWERLYEVHHGDGGLTGEELAGFAELGWFGLVVPEPAGGGATLLDAAIVIEEFGYAAVPAPVLAANAAAALLAAVEGSTVEGHLAGIARGRPLYTFSDAARRRGSGAVNLRGRAAGDAPSLTAAGGTLSGTLPLLPFASICDFVLAPLAVEGEPAFAVVPLAGARLEEVEVLDRRGYANAHFEKVALDGEAVLATGARAIELHERFDALVTALSLIELVGMMQRILEMTTEYVTTRVQFGKPIGTFQAVRHRAAELLMQTDTTRWAAYHALWRLQEDPTDSEEVWLAKHWAIGAANRVYQIAHLLHGGVGVGTEYPLHLLTQALVSFTVRGGTMDEMVDRTLETMKRRQTVEATT